MILSGGRSFAATPVRRAALFAVLTASVAAISALLISVNAPGGQLARAAAAGAATWIAYAGWRSASGRERRARAWIGFAVAVWFISETTRLIGIVIGHPTQLAELSVIGLGIGAVGTYVTAAHRRMRTADEVALYLDAAAVFFGLVGAVLVFGSSVVSDSTGFAILAHAAFFVAILAATLLLNLSTRAPVRFIGPWELLAGLALGAVGYLGLLVPGADATLHAALNGIVAVGALLVGHGGANWNAAEDRSGRYVTVAGSLRALLPLSSALLTGAVGLVLIAEPNLVTGLLRLGVALTIGFVIISVVARQTLLLVDREGVLRRERDLTDELTVAEAQYRSVVERVPGVVYVAEAGQHGRWHFVSTKIEDLLGFTPEEWTSDPTLWMSRMHPADRDRMIMAESDDHGRSEAKGRWEYRLLARDGRIVWVIDDEAVIARDHDGRPTMVQGILVDISDRKDLEDQLRHQAVHDPLTGLPNRVLFVDRLTHALVRRGQPDTGVAVLFVDLDDFKAVNDTLGHAVGDQLLRLVGARLSQVVRMEDTACRLGGDEFAFLLEDATADRANDVADRILHALAEPFELGIRTASLSASIGITTRDRITQDGDPAAMADDLLRDADTAMYAAKSLGKGRVRVFDRRMEEPAGRRRELRNSLERALETDELVLEYQPIVDLRTGTTVGLESLVRWNHPQLGRLMPADFIPLAEDSGLIGHLGDWVLRTACADLASATTLVSINVSAHQLGGGELPIRIGEILRTTGFPASRMLLELTESTLASAGHGAETELLAIQSLGVRIALDDFGSGYSSLEYLGRLPIDVLKIDRSLIERVHTEPQRQEVLRAIRHIADKLGLDTIVEGVENEEQRMTLLELGFRQAQGFLFSHALPLGPALAATQFRRAS